MYIAELKGKLSPIVERQEDILTSNVFSFFMYASREIFLLEFLASLGFIVSVDDARQAEFIFWPSYKDGTEPDLVIIVGKFYLLIEAKLYSGFGKAKDHSFDQLKRELNGGNQEAQTFEKEFHLIAITAHYSKHHFIAENPEFADEVLTWTNWHHVALLLYRLLESDLVLDSGTESFASDLYNLLVKKNLRKYAGLDVFQLSKLIVARSENIFFDPQSAQYRGAFLGFKQALNGFTHFTQFDHIFIFDQQNFNGSKEKIETIPKIIFFERKT